MNKEAAAKSLGISQRTLEYHVKQGNISQGWTKGKTGKVADFTGEEVERLKKHLQSASNPRAAIDRSPANPENTETGLARLDQTALLPVLQVLERMSAGRSALVTILRASEVSGLSETVIRRAIKAGHLKAVKGIGVHGATLLRESEVMAYANRLFDEAS